MMKNAFYFPLKAFYFPLISKFMMSQPGYQTIAMHILPSISRSKDNETMKFGQLIENNIRNIFTEKS